MQQKYKKKQLEKAIDEQLKLVLCVLLDQSYFL